MKISHHNYGHQSDHSVWNVSLHYGPFPIKKHTFSYILIEKIQLVNQHNSGFGLGNKTVWFSVREKGYG